MIKIEYEIGGRKVSSLAQFTNEIEKIVLNQVTDHIKKQVGGVICQKHGSHPTVRVKGRTFDKLQFEVSGCCQEIVDAVNAKLR